MRNAYRLARGLFFLCIAISIAACSTPGPFLTVEERPLSTNAIYVKQVPFYPQTQYQCGPAALATVLNYYGRHVTPEQIAQEIYRPRMKGTLSLDLWQYAKTQDLQASVQQGSWEFLEMHVSRERPIIAFLNFGFREVPLGHFLVVVGVDRDDKSVIAYSGTDKNQRIPFDRFKAAWQKTNYWSLLIEPKAGSDQGA
jgi:ABC-type bacteriocin/lantibiotic exporter with double-glycine peptidase domain